MIHWRPMVAADLDRVNVIANLIHLDYPESPAVFANRLHIFADGCWMAQQEDGLALGYAISHPGRVGHPPHLDCVLESLPNSADCLYLHDVALLPQARGQGLSRAIVQHLEIVARRCALPRLALTSVSGSLPVWSRCGFVPHPCDDLDSYGTATYMIRSV